MIGRESGMPVEEIWDAFFDADTAIERIFGSKPIEGDVVDFGCGYGTFTIPAAVRTRGTLTALDIDPQMVGLVEEKAAQLGLKNIRGVVGDFLSERTGLAEDSQMHAMVFNLLHIEDPLALLAEVRRIVSPNGSVSVVHWRSDIPTPRGPPLSIRPSPEQCRDWLQEAGFDTVKVVDVADECPYHFVLLAR
jgi:ubiquinone/menaquinone biosynthesis C-methylase UbiE